MELMIWIILFSTWDLELGHLLFYISVHMPALFSMELELLFYLPPPFLILAFRQMPLLRQLSLSFMKIRYLLVLFFHSKLMYYFCLWQYCWKKWCSKCDFFPVHFLEWPNEQCDWQHPFHYSSSSRQVWASPSAASYSSDPKGVLQVLCD